jgi:hypothetical protein
MRLLVSLLLIGISLTLTAQDKRKWYDEPEPKKEEVISELTAGDYLIKSANMQYAAIGLGAVTAFIAYQNSKIIQNGSTTDTKVFNGIAVACGVGTAALGVLAIHYKRQAGITLNQHASLNTYLSPSGLTFALKF